MSRMALAAPGLLWLDRLSRITTSLLRNVGASWVFYIEIEHLAVHCPEDDPRRVQPVVPQGTNERLGVPMPERGVVDQALSPRRPTGGLCHIGFDGGFVDENQSFQMVGHEGLALGDPDAP